MAGMWVRLGLVGIAVLLAPGAASAGSQSAAEQALEAKVESGIRAGGPFFTADERAVIERKCGYAPGDWDGFDFSMSDDVLICKNGRHVAHDPEVNRVMRAATPRIGRRVEAVMESAEVRTALDKVVSEATAEALAEVDRTLRPR